MYLIVAMEGFKSLTFEQWTAIASDVEEMLSQKHDELNFEFEVRE